ncbi:MAG: hypothetical protein NXI20_17890 [bacterium]|nr:hypothetical protein [bacterium]
MAKKGKTEKSKLTELRMELQEKVELLLGVKIDPSSVKVVK